LLRLYLGLSFFLCHCSSAAGNKPRNWFLSLLRDNLYLAVLVAIKASGRGEDLAHLLLLLFLNWIGFRQRLLLDLLLLPLLLDLSNSEPPI